MVTVSTSSSFTAFLRHSRSALREEMDQYDILVLYNIMAGCLMQNGEWREEFNK